MPQRHRKATARRLAALKLQHHSVTERKHLRAIKRKQGPSGLRRKERRVHLQPKPSTEEAE